MLFCHLKTLGELNPFGVFGSDMEKRLLYLIDGCVQELLLKFKQLP